MNMSIEHGLDKIKRDLVSRIGGISADKIVFVGVGNRMRGDDAIGPVLADLLAPHVPHSIDTGSVPENYTSLIKRLKPEAIIFLDALFFRDLPPGYPVLVEIDEVKRCGLSTHKFSLDMIMEYLKEDTGADVFMIGVQPGNISDREMLTPGLDSILRELANVILGVLRQ